MHKWKLSEAKEHFDEIISLADKGETQMIKNKKSHIYVVPEKEYKSSLKEERMSFKDMLLSIPKSNSDEEDDDFESGRRGSHGNNL